MNWINSLKPGVDKSWLYIIAGLMWSGVGIYLDLLAYVWLTPNATGSVLLFISLGLLLAVMVYAMMFKPFADLNIARIRHLKDGNICIFAFQRWTSYLLVVIMISLGIYLRIYSPIPKSLLAIMYIGIGSALVFASLRYFRILLNIYR